MNDRYGEVSRRWVVRLECTVSEVYGQLLCNGTVSRDAVSTVCSQLQCSSALGRPQTRMHY